MVDGVERIVSLELDAAQYMRQLEELRRAQRDAANALKDVERNTKGVERATQDAAAEMSRMRAAMQHISGAANAMRTSMRSAFAAFGGLEVFRQIVGPTERIAADIDAMSKAANAVELPIEEFQRFRTSLALSGTDIEGAQTALQRFAAAIDEYRRTGKGSAANTIEALGLDVDAPMDAILRDLFTRTDVGLSEWTDLFGKQGRLAASQLAQSFQETYAQASTIPAVDQASADALQAANDRIDVANAALTASMTQAAVAVRNGIAEMREALVGLAPVLSSVFAGFGDVINTATSALQALKANVPTETLQAFGRAAAYVGTALAALGLAGLTAQLVALAAPIAALMVPLTPFIAALGAVGGGVALLIDQILKFTGVSDSWGQSLEIMVGWLKSFISWVSDAAVEVGEFFGIVAEDGTEIAGKIEALQRRIADARGIAAQARADQNEGLALQQEDNIAAYVAEIEELSGKLEKAQAAQEALNRARTAASTPTRIEVRPAGVLPAPADPDGARSRPSRLAPTADDYEEARRAYEELARQQASAYNEETGRRVDEARSLAERIFDSRRGELAPLTLQLPDGSFETICTEIRDMSRQHDDCLRLEMEADLQREQVAKAAEDAVVAARGTMNERVEIPVAPDAQTMAKLIADAVEIARKRNEEAAAQERVNAALKAAVPLAKEVADATTAAANAAAAPLPRRRPETPAPSADAALAAAREFAEIQSGVARSSPTGLAFLLPTAEQTAEMEVAADRLRTEMEGWPAAARQAMTEYRSVLNTEGGAASEEAAALAGKIGEALRINVSLRNDEADAIERVNRASVEAEELAEGSRRSVEDIRDLWNEVAAAAGRWVDQLKTASGIDLSAIGRGLAGVAGPVSGLFSGSGPLAGITNSFGPQTSRTRLPNAGVQQLVRTAVTEVLGPNARVVVNSGVREGGNDPSGRHRTGDAIDVTVIDATGNTVRTGTETSAQLIRAFARHGAEGIGAGSEYMGGSMFHVDTVGTAAGGGHVWASQARAMADELRPILEANQRAGGAVTAATPGPNGQAILALTEAAREIAAGSRALASPAATTDVRKAFLDAVAAVESQGSGDYAALNRSSGASGRYQFLPSTWEEQSARLGLRDFSPASQDAAAWAYAQQRFGNVGGGLEATLARGDITTVMQRLDETWTGIAANSEKFASTLAAGLGQPAAAGVPVPARSPVAPGVDASASASAETALRVAQGAQGAAAATQGWAFATREAHDAIAALQPRTAQINADMQAFQTILASGKQSQDAITAAVSAYADSTVNAATNTAEYKREMAELQAIQSSGLLPSREFTARLGEIKAGMADVGATGQQLQQTLATGIGETIGGSLSAMINAMASGEKPAKAFFKAMISGFANLASQLANQAIQNLLKGAFNPSGAPGAAPGGGIFGSLIGGIGKGIGSIFGKIFGGLFAKGAAFGAGGKGVTHGVYDAPTPFTFDKGSLGVLGEAGPEAVMPLTRDGGKLGVVAHGAGGSTVLPLTRGPDGKLGVQFPGMEEATRALAGARRGVHDAERFARSTSVSRFARGDTFGAAGGFLRHAISSGAMAERSAASTLTATRAVASQSRRTAAAAEKGGGLSGGIVINNNGPPMEARTTYDPERERLTIETTLRAVEDQIRKGATPISRALEGAYAGVRRRGL